jgi:hypothetical protein
VTLLCKDITVAMVKAMLRYEPKSGLIFYREKPEYVVPEASLAWRRSRGAGFPAVINTLSPSGYLVGSFCSVQMKAHRVACVLMNGAWPVMVDHIDGDPSNNVWSNLRATDPLGNSRNAKRSSRNTSGVCGVEWNRGVRKWRAHIGSGKGRVYLGAFPSLEEAAAARKSAERRMGFHENHGR